MRIGFDARCLQTASGGGGVGRYARGLIEHLPPAGDEMLVYVSSRRPLPEIRRFPGSRFAPLRRPARMITLWDSIAWPVRLRRDRLDVFHSPFYGVPRRGRAGTGVVATVHDLIPILFEAAVTRKQRLIFMRHFRQALTAHRIIVPSLRTRQDLIDRLGADPRKIAVLPLGLDERLISPPAGKVEEFRRRVARAGPYVLHAGGWDPVKDLPTLLKAFARVSRPRRDLCLVVCGEASGERARSFSAAAREIGLGDRVVLPGRLSDAELAAAYAGAELFAFPSQYEGFGLPPLEAMANRCPVVSSSGGSLEEVLGDGALLVPPRDVDALAGAMERVLSDAALRAHLAAAGSLRARRFRWDEAARGTVEVYRRAMAEARGEAMVAEETLA